MVNLRYKEGTGQTPPDTEEHEMTAKTATAKKTVNASKAATQKIAAQTQTAKAGTCLCGCGVKVDKTYRPGHDARHVSQLVNALFEEMQNGEGDRAAYFEGNQFYGEVARGITGLPTVALQVKYVGAVNRRAMKEFDRWAAKVERNPNAVAPFAWHPEDVLLKTPTQYREAAGA